MYSFPVFVGSLMDALVISERGIGIIASTELVGIAIASAVIAGNLTKLNLRSTGIRSAFVIAVGHGLTLVTDSMWGFLCARFIAGLGEGSALAAMNAVGVTAKIPERGYAIAQIATSITTALLLWTFPTVIINWNYRVGLAVYAILPLFFIPLIAALPRDINTFGVSPKPQEQKRFPFKLQGVLVLGAFLLLNMTDIGLWVFAERIGISIGIGLEKIGFLLGAATMLGMFGPILVTIIVTRVNKAFPMLIGLLAFSVVAFIFCHATNEIVYTVFLLPKVVLALFLIPYFLGTLADLDVNGSWVAASTIFGAIGMAIAPVVAGHIAVTYSYAGIGWYTSGCALIACIIMFFVFSSKPFKVA